MSIVLLSVCSVLVVGCYAYIIKKRRNYAKRVKLGMLTFTELVREIMRFYSYGLEKEYLVAETMRTGKFFQFRLLSDNAGAPFLISDIPHVNVPLEEIHRLEEHLDHHNWQWTNHEEEGMRFCRIRIDPNREALHRFLSDICKLIGVEDTEVFNIAEGSGTYRILGIIA
ncbi:hypothetical protein [Aliiroseovarius sp. 2305UL8-7]|uniref:hypothetical protein n=1 Tax=Aliiroseovarius conchicola TaxID=3121637 RepID=UPI003527A363